jgi:hypothetical protein
MSNIAQNNPAGTANISQMCTRRCCRMNQAQKPAKISIRGNILDNEKSVDYDVHFFMIGAVTRLCPLHVRIVSVCGSTSGLLGGNRHFCCSLAEILDPNEYCK